MSAVIGPAGHAATVFTGEVLHARLLPQRHVFRYGMFFCSVDIDRLSELARHSALFGYNVFRPLSIHDRDYLPGAEGGLRARLETHLANRGVSLPKGRIELVTVPRFFGYVFNPVSFYQCRDETGAVSMLVAEVNNTFGETHLYIVDRSGPPDDYRSDAARVSRKPKVFHVSPFLDRKGDYAFSLREGDKDGKPSLDLRVDLEREGKTVFVSRLWGTGEELSSRTLFRALLRRPFSPWLTFPRILWEAVKMRLLKRLAVYPRPVADSVDTLRASAPSYVNQACRALLRRSLKKLKHGSLTLCYPTGETEVYGDVASPLAARILVRNTNMFRRVVRFGDIGFGDSYMDGEWDSDNLTRLLEFFVANGDVFNDRTFLSTWYGRIRHRLAHGARRNSRVKAKENIERHYDLSNDFFRCFLDSTMNYSAAIFKSEGDTLEEAQNNKMRAILEKAQLKPGMQLLEIGSGWGSLALLAAKEYGVSVKSITLSSEQCRLARERAAREGLDDRVSFEICDYRELQGRFDRIVSVEMLEAVGHRYYPNYFQTLERVLKPEGIAVIQVIAIPEQRYDEYRRSCDWIQKHIFPGGETPSLEVLLTSMRKHSQLFVDDVENIGVHYARTLREWRERFRKSRNAVQELGFDERFQRMWEYYLCYCEAGFSTRFLSTYQLVLTRSRNPNLAPCPGYDGPPVLR